MISAINSGAGLMRAGEARLDRAAEELARPGQPDPSLERTQNRAAEERTTPTDPAVARSTEGAAAYTEADVVRSSVDLITAPQEMAAGSTVIRQAAAAYESVMALGAHRNED